VLVTPWAVMAQVPSTLDAQFPSDHEYVVAVWFEKQDKAGTFKFRIMDTSIPGNYNRQAWQDANTKWNDPNGRGVMRIFPVRTWQSMGATEREQVMARIKQERDRIEFQNLPSVDVKPEGPKKQTKKDSGKTTFEYKEDAEKSLTGTTWRFERRPPDEHGVWKFRDKYLYVEDEASNDPTRQLQVGTWQQNGNSVFVKDFQGNEYFHATIVEGNRMHMFNFPEKGIEQWLIKLK